MTKKLQCESAGVFFELILLKYDVWLLEWLNFHLGICIRIPISSLRGGVKRKIIRKGDFFYL